MAAGVIAMLGQISSSSDLASMICDYMEWMQPRLGKVVAILKECQSASDVKNTFMAFLKLPKLRAVQVGRFLSYCDSRFSFFTYDDIGDGACKAVASILQTPTESYKPSEGDLQKVKAIVVEKLKALDEHQIIDQLEQLGLEPLSLHNIQHFCCELRKIVDGCNHDFQERPHYKELWGEVAALESQLRRHVKRRRLCARATI